MKRELVDQVIDAYGGVKSVMERFNYKQPMAVYNWRSRGIPERLHFMVYRDTGIDVTEEPKKVA